MRVEASSNTRTYRIVVAVLVVVALLAGTVMALRSGGTGHARDGHD
jgi:hypothetical protein